MMVNYHHFSQLCVRLSGIIELGVSVGVSVNLIIRMIVTIETFFIQNEFVPGINFLASAH